jgi:hypothetical protein
MSRKPVLIHQDILIFPSNMIVHQSNAVTKGARGLSKAIFKKYPYSDIYSPRKLSSEKDTLLPLRSHGGNYAWSENNNNEGKKDDPVVVSIIGQLAPGFPSDKKSINHWQTFYHISPKEDTSEKRLLYFKTALQKLATKIKEQQVGTDPEPYIIAFPHNIGCGLAGGDWGNYSSAIQEFYNQFISFPHIQIAIVKK